MNKIYHLAKKSSHLVIGLMSGTCTDGIDAALVQIEGHSTDTKVQLLKFITIPYEAPLRTLLLELSRGNTYGSEEVCKVNFLLGQLFAEACVSICRKANIACSEVDFIGSHGHTIYHQPAPAPYFNHTITSTLQVGEAAVISEIMKCPVISDFRVRDVAAGGQGAPLVPYTEYLLYRQKEKAIALQNIGGIGNITYLPANCDINQIIAFDTGPGNMMIDALAALYSDRKLTYDANGNLARAGTLQTELLDWLMQDDYIHRKAPKTTGREYYGTDYVNRILHKAEDLGISLLDTITTVTMFTAKSIEFAIKYHLPHIPDELIVGGGGSLNQTLMADIMYCLPECKVLTNEDLGLSSKAKEAIAFAVLANETVFGHNNNVPAATGAGHGVVMGKITL
jgi:anhydro-N-acetylmuramic acid kinase